MIGDPAPRPPRAGHAGTGSKHTGRDRCWQLVERRGVDLVLDVGANVGQFARRARSSGYRGRIVSFEPQVDAYRALEEACAADVRWDCVRLALGDENRDRAINIAGNSQSSSFLPMLDRHADAAPQSRYGGTEVVAVRRLDAVFDDLCRAEEIVFLKLDVQGYEKRVLDGAAGVLDRIPLIQMELSLVPLYLGETLLEEMISILRRLDYDPVSIAQGFADPRSGHLLQVDVVFERRA